MKDEDKKTDKDDEHVLTIHHDNAFLDSNSKPTKLSNNKPTPLVQSNKSQETSEPKPQQVSKNTLANTKQPINEHQNTIYDAPLTQAEISEARTTTDKPTKLNTVSHPQKSLRSDQLFLSDESEQNNDPYSIDHKKSNPITVFTDEQQLGQPQDTKPTVTKSKSYLKPIIITLVVVVIGLLGFYLLFTSKVSYKSYTLSNDKYTYSFLFYSDSTHNATNLHNQVTGDNNSISASAYTSLWSESCQQEFPKIKVIFQATIQNQKFPVCAEPGQTVIFSSFKYKGTWQEVVIYSNNTTSQVSSSVARKTIDSIKIH
jgi:hypothetical protein